MKFHTVDAQGKFWTERVDDIDTTRHTTVVDEARLVYSHSNSNLYFGRRDGWAVVMGKYDFMTADTRIMFGHTPIPDGWNINTTKNDMTVMTVLDDSVGQIKGSWTISGMETAGQHDHGGFTGAADLSAQSFTQEENGATDPNHQHSINMDGVHIHGFDINWRPKYIKFVEAKFD